MEEVTRVVSNVAVQFVEAYGLDGVEEINKGLCVEFAEEVVSRLVKVGIKAEEVSEDELRFDEGYTVGFEDEEGLPEYGWNQVAIEQVYHSPLPVPLSVFDDHEGSGYHMFIEAGGRFYDAECADGVTNLWELPHYVRFLKRINV